MSRLKQYINEIRTEDITSMLLLDQLIKDCKPMLKLLKKSPRDYLYRGSSRNISGTLKLKNRGNRKPKYISNTLHDYMNKELHEMFGWYPRSDGVFTASWRIAGDYGNNRYIVLPVGNFTYIVHPSVQSLWDFFDGKVISTIDKLDPDEKNSRLRNIDRGLENYTDKNLHIIIRGSYFECILNCKYYYIVNMSLEPDLRNIINGI